MNAELEQYFIHIISKGKKDNTYKFALAKFLLDTSLKASTHSNLKISYEEISTAFLKYYWFQECKYKIKQDFKQSSQPAIITIIQDYCGTDYIADSYDKYFKKHSFKEDIILDIEKKCLDNVIPRFQPDDRSLFYKHQHVKSLKKYKKPKKDERYILVHKQTIQFLKNNYELLHKTLILEWAKFLEKTNFTPRLISKIENLGDTKRSSLTKFKKILLSLDKRKRCFYCNDNLDEKNIHVDHFIPWSYVYDDEIWNLVLSCSDCNLKKSDYLADKACLEKIKDRNNKYKLEQPNKNIDDFYYNCKKSGFLELSEKFCTK